MKNNIDNLSCIPTLLEVSICNIENIKGMKLKNGNKRQVKCV